MTAPLVVPVAGYMTLSRLVRCRSRPTSSLLGMACLLRRWGGGALPFHLRLCAQLLPPVDPRRCAAGIQRRVFAPPVAKLALDGFPGGDESNLEWLDCVRACERAGQGLHRRARA